MSRRHLRISFSDCSEEEGARRCSYLVRMIKPNLIDSHDWHVQPYCQRSLRASPPERFPYGSRPKPLGLSVPELVALVEFSGFPPFSAFWRDFLRLSKTYPVSTRYF